SGTAPTFECESAEVKAASLVLAASPSTREAGDIADTYGTACAAPSADNQKGVSRLVIANVDTIAHTFFLRTNDDGSYTYQLPGTQMEPNEFCTYEVGHGWQFFDAQGNRK